MTERGRDCVSRDSRNFVIGPSAVSWDGTALRFTIDEAGVPIPLRIKGQVRLYPAAITRTCFMLDQAERHRWWPVAPCSRIEVELERPAIRWSGSGYLDINDGDEALEDGFSHWDWARASLDGGRRAVLLYDVLDRQREHSSLAIQTDDQGRTEPVEMPRAVRLPRTLWQMRRGTRVSADGGARVRSTLEDTPFYARSLLSTHLFGQDAPAMHESLSLDRFRTRWVKALLPYRMPRRTE